MAGGRESHLQRGHRDAPQPERLSHGHADRRRQRRPPALGLLPLLERHIRSDAGGRRAEQADVRKDTVSLARLLDQIRGKPQRLTRDGFVERFDPDDIRAGFATWSRLLAGRVRDYVDPALVKADLDELRAAAEQAKDWADKRVAHTGREQVAKPPTLGELDGAIDTIGRVFERYNLLLLGSSYHHLAPPGVREDLDALFRQAWVRCNE
jgi:hypothetical protein